MMVIMPYHLIEPISLKQTKGFVEGREREGGEKERGRAREGGGVELELELENFILQGL